MPIGALLGQIIPSIIGAVVGGAGNEQVGGSPYQASESTTKNTNTNELEKIIKEAIAKETGTETTINEYADENVNNLNNLLTETLATEAPGIIASGREAGALAQQNFQQVNEQFLPSILQGLSSGLGNPDDVYANAPETAIARRFLEDSRGSQNAAFAGGFNDVGSLSGSRQAGADNLLQGRVAENLGASIADRTSRERLGYAQIAPSAFDAAASLPGAGLQAQIAPITALGNAVKAITPDQLTKSQTTYSKDAVTNSNSNRNLNAQGLTTSDTQGTRVSENPGQTVGDIASNILRGGGAGYDIGGELVNAFSNRKPKAKPQYAQTDRGDYT